MSEMRKFSLNLPLSLAERVDAYASDMNITRSSAMNVLLTTALNQAELTIKTKELIGKQQPMISDLALMLGQMKSMIDEKDKN